MWRRPTESGISFICILAPTRFFVKSIKINIAHRGLKISLPASSFSPLPSFWQTKNSLLFLYHRLRQSRFLQTQKKSALPDGFFSLCKTKNYLNKLRTFWLDWFAAGWKSLYPQVPPARFRVFGKPKTRSYLFLTGSGKPGCSKKKCTPRGAFFKFSRNFISISTS